MKMATIGGVAIIGSFTLIGDSMYIGGSGVCKRIFLYWVHNDGFYHLVGVRQVTR